MNKHAIKRIDLLSIAFIWWLHRLSATISEWWCRIFSRTLILWVNSIYWYPGSPYASSAFTRRANGTFGWSHGLFLTSPFSPTAVMPSSTTAYTICPLTLSCPWMLCARSLRVSCRSLRFFSFGGIANSTNNSSKKSGVWRRPKTRCGRRKWNDGTLQLQHASLRWCYFLDSAAAHRTAYDRF